MPQRGNNDAIRYQNFQAASISCSMAHTSDAVLFWSKIITIMVKSETEKKCVFCDRSIN